MKGYCEFCKRLTDDKDIILGNGIGRGELYISCNKKSCINKLKERLNL